MNNKKLSEIVNKILHKSPCQYHNAQLTHYSLKRQKIVCEGCKWKDDTHISITDIINNPISVIKGINQLLPNSQYYENIKKYKACYKISNTFETIISQIQSKLTKYCQQLRHKFNEQWDAVMKVNKQELQQLDRIQTNYRLHFQTILSQQFINGTPAQLQSIINTFIHHNEDPTSNITSIINNIHNTTMSLPYVNFHTLTSLYETVTNPILWNTQDILTQHSSKLNRQKIIKHQHTLLPNFQNTLQDHVHTLQFNQHQLTFSNSQNQQTKTLKQCNDFMVQLQKYKLLGVNYNSIKLYSYAFGNIEKRKEYAVEGCTHFLTYQNCLILIANSRLIRFWLQDGKQEILGFNYHSISYSDYKQNFIAIDNEGKEWERPFLHNII